MRNVIVMKHKIYYSPAACRDLDEIWDYITHSLRNRSAAERIVDRVIADMDQLELFAEIGAPLSSIADVESDERFLTTESYLTFYRARGGTVYIDRILNGRCDYLSILLQSRDGQVQI